MDENSTWLKGEATRGRAVRLACLFAEWRAQDGIHPPQYERRAYEVGNRVNVIHSVEENDDDEDDDVRPYFVETRRCFPSYDEDLKEFKRTIKSEDTKNGLQFVYIDDLGDEECYLVEDGFGYKNETSVGHMRVYGSDPNVQIIKVTKGLEKTEVIDLTGDTSYTYSKKEETQYLMTPAASIKSFSPVHRELSVINFNKYAKRDQPPPRRDSSPLSKRGDPSRGRSLSPKRERSLHNIPQTPYRQRTPGPKTIDLTTPPQSPNRKPSVLPSKFISTHSRIQSNRSRSKFRESETLQELFDRIFSR